MRSLVPMVRKSTSLASRSAASAAAGTSIIAPTGTGGDAELLAHAVSERAGLARLFDARHEGEHDAQRPVRGSAHQRAELRAEHLGMREAEPQAAKPGASAVPPRRQAAHEVPFVEVERADGHPPRRDLLEHAAIRRVLRDPRSRHRASGPRAGTPNDRGRRPRRRTREETGRSSTSSMLASSRTGTPSAVSSGPRDDVARLVRRRGRSARRCAVSSSGPSAPMTTSPVVPSRMMVVPAGTRAERSCRPTTAGTFSERARMAVWYVRLPASTAKPCTARPVQLRRERGRELVGDQDRWPVELLQQLAQVGALVLRRFIRRRPATSATSVSRSRRYGSSMLPNSRRSSS